MKTTDYNFSLLKGTFEPLNGTLWQLGTQLNVDTSTEITLPSSFIFCGTTYNSARIYNNGFITLGKGLDNGSIMDATVKSPISNTVKGWACDYVVSAFGVNLMANNKNSSISHGLNTNGDFVVQFSEVSIMNYSGTKVSFQIVLKLDNTIQFVYSDAVGQAGAVNPQIGLRGKSELVNGIYTYNDWNNRKLITGNWNTLEANSNLPNNSKGTMPSSAMAFKDTTVLPQNGLTFIWNL